MREQGTLVSVSDESSRHQGTIKNQVSSVSTQGGQELASAVQRIHALEQAFASVQTATNEQYQITSKMVQRIDNTTAQAANIRDISNAIANLARSVQEAVNRVKTETSKFHTG
ncbi:hypothetical protein CCP3SC1_50047 [Gammaproteobacteria bacterium]